MMKSKILILVLFILLAPLPIRADYVNLTGAENAPNLAEIYVNDDHVKLVMEVFVRDLDKFLELIPDHFFQEGMKLPPRELRMDRFSREVFQIIPDGGEGLQARLELSEPRIRKERESPFVGMINPATRMPIPGPPEDKRVLYAELTYPFEKKPDTLTIIPPKDDSGRPAASIGFITYHRGVIVNDFRFLSEKAVLTLDWEDPWYSHFQQKAYKRWRQSGINAYLYIEPYEVRYEFLARVKDLEAWMDLGLRNPGYIEADEFEPLKQRIGKFIMEGADVLIDGEERRPILDRVTFVRYTLTRTIFIQTPERMPLETAVIGVIVTYLTEGMPREVTAHWSLFSGRIQKVPTVAVDPAGPFPSYVTPDDNVFRWTNYLKKYRIPTVTEISVDEALTTIRLPALALLCLMALFPVFLQIRNRKRNGAPTGLFYTLGVVLLAGALLTWPYYQVPVAKPALMAPELTEEESVEILQGLLKNVYRAFDFREEEDVYDRLARSVSGDLLTDIYLQNRRSFEVQRAGGARAKVKEVEILDVSVKNLADPPLGMLFRSEWTAMGTVGHWGHIHSRKNRYDADITVEPVDGAWRITGLEVREEERIDPFAQPVAEAPSGG
jgi:hypothetical protein